MKWFSHITVAASTAALVNPALVPVVALGATAPDWLERLYKIATGGRQLRHRGPTHYMAAWLVCLAFGLFLYDYHHWFAGFAYGGLSHVMLDACTITGVPFSPLSMQRVHFLGGRIRTGDHNEYIFVAVVFVVCLTLVRFTAPHVGYVPFFTDWEGLHKRGLVSAYEWKQNRFRWF